MLKTSLFIPLPQFTLLKISGEEAVTFLQGQFTNDVKQIRPDYAQLSAWCSAKGRIMVNFYLFWQDNAFYLILPKDSIETVQKRLKMFILRTKVSVEISTLACMGIAGTDITTSIQNTFEHIPPLQPYHQSTTNHSTIIFLGEKPQPYFLIIAEPNILNTAEAQLTTQGLQKAPPETWELIHILAGIPLINSTLADEFIPQMLNYDLLGGVNFKKGCYSGQEIVARTQYLGNLKRRMYLFSIQSEILPTVGEKIYVSDGQQVGEMVNIQADSAGEGVGLAVVQIESVAAEKLYFLAGENKVFLKKEDLPYSLS